MHDDEFLDYSKTIRRIVLPVPEKKFKFKVNDTPCPVFSNIISKRKMDIDDLLVVSKPFRKMLLPPQKKIRFSKNDKITSTLCPVFTNAVVKPKIIGYCLHLPYSFMGGKFNPKAEKQVINGLASKSKTIKQQEEASRDP